MALWLRPVAAALALISCAAFSPLQDRVVYTLTPLLQDGALTAVQIDLQFRGRDDGETVLRLPDEWGGETDLHRSVQDLEVLSPGAALRHQDEAAIATLSHRPHARVHVRYRIIQDWEGAPPAGRNTYRPIVQPTYFHLIGEAALVTPDLHNATPTRLRVRGMPRGWSFASDLQHPGLALGHVWASVTVGGDYRVHRAADRNIRVAIRGNWSFEDQAFVAQAGEIISGHRRFWSDRSSPYLVTVTQTVSPNPGHISVGGTGLDDAFAFFATASVDAAPITRTLAHESLHSWIPGRIGGMPQEDEAASYWLSEGFTDFYTGRMLVREGLWTPQQFAEDLNEMLGAYAQSPVRDAPNARILANFWTDAHVQQLPYQRGRLLATIWDARLRSSGGSLDAALMQMRQRAEAGDPAAAPDMLPQVLASLGLDVRADIARYVDAGTRIVLPANVFAPCGRLVTHEVAAFDPGFDADAMRANDGLISGVDPNLPAYAAGLRDGMAFVRHEAGRVGDSTREFVLVVRDGEEERIISYFPRSRALYLTQRLEIDPALDAASFEQCRAALGGG